ncbi:hypothetical protein DHX103_11580 [Planococcus sp. X10-3]|uniref:hypothetical protein n=1 Tax=Planococcus sp. X10-3 TaxID=3061240 RepID=UPI003BB08142
MIELPFLINIGLSVIIILTSMYGVKKSKTNGKLLPASLILLTVGIISLVVNAFALAAI